MIQVESIFAGSGDSLNEVLILWANFSDFTNEIIRDGEMNPERRQLWG